MKGVGSVRGKTFQTLGVETIRDLLYYFPRRHLDRTALTKINQLKVDSQATIIVGIESFRERRFRKGRIFQVVVSDDSGLLSLNWFNGIRFVKNLFQIGDKLANRSAQKGVIGMVLEPENMPYTKNGIIPDIVINTLLK